MIKTCNAPMGAGKTTQITEKALANLAKGNSTLILVPSHAAVREVLARAASVGIKAGYMSHLRGKRDDVCLPEHLKKQCKKCPVYKKADRESLLFDDIDFTGHVFDTEKLVKLAEDNGLCAMLASRLLAAADRPKNVVATHAFLASKPAFDILTNLKFQHILVDEADALFETLLANNQRELQLVRARQAKAHCINGRCNEVCKGCIPHISDQPGKHFSPRGGRVDDLPSTANVLNAIELISDAIERIKKGVGDGVVVNIFDFENIETMMKRVFAALPEYQQGTSALDYLHQVEEKNKVNRVCLDERDDEGSDFVVPIEVLPIAFDEYDELSSQCEFPNIDTRLSSLRLKILIDPKSEAAKALAPFIETFLAFVDFIHCAPGHVYLVPQKHRVGIRSSGAEHCSMSLRYLDTRHYQRVGDYLQDKTKLLSGTLFTADMIAASLLLERDQISLKSIDPKFHKSALIIVHTPRKSGQSGVSVEQAARTPQAMPPWAAARLYELIQEKIADIQILHFSVNTREAGQFFRKLTETPTFTRQFRIENRLKNKIEIDQASSQEELHDQRTALLSIDKLRSSTSRAVNRAGFQLCAVWGNGIANWSDRIALFLEARKLQDGLTLRDFIAYEQKRAVMQALTRAPRDAAPTVCIYTGNLHVMAFPPYLKNRIVTTDELVDIYCRDVELPTKKSETLEYQLRALAHGIAVFLKDGTIAIERSRIEVGDSVLNKWPGRRAVGEERLRHVDSCIESKGYVDRVADRKGERPEWTAFLDWLVAANYLQPELRGRKEVYMKFKT